ncbi:MAG: pentapeptide repeat-containing protein [Actinomycetes bacterium]
MKARAFVAAVGLAALAAATLSAGPAAATDSPATPDSPGTTGTAAPADQPASPIASATMADDRASSVATTKRSRPKVKLTDVRLSHSDRLVQATIAWHQSLLDKPGKDDLDLRALVRGRDGRLRTLVANRGSLRPDQGNVTHYRASLSKRNAELLRTAQEVTVTVTQSFDSARDRDHKYETNYVTVRHFKPRSTRAVELTPRKAWTSYVPAGRGTCSGVKIGTYSHLAGCNLTGASLDGAVINQSDFTGADMTGDILSHTNMNQSTFTNATLTNADLTSADMSISTVAGMVMRSAMAPGIDMSNTNANLSQSTPPMDLSGTTMTNAQLVGSSWSGANLSSMKLNGSSLMYTKLQYATIIGGTWFSGTDLTQVDFSNANLTLAIFSGLSDYGHTTLMLSTIFQSTNLTDAVFDSQTPTTRPTIGYHTDPTEQSAATRRWNTSVNFTNANMTRTSLRGIRLWQPSFYQANLNGTDLSYSYLDADVNDQNGVEMVGATLTNTKILNAYINHLDIVAATLSNADFTGTTITARKNWSMTGCASVIGTTNFCTDTTGW